MAAIHSRGARFGARQAGTPPPAARLCRPAASLGAACGTKQPFQGARSASAAAPLKALFSRRHTGRRAPLPRRSAAVKVSAYNFEAAWITTSVVRSASKYQGTKFALDFLAPAKGSQYNGVVLFLHGFEQVPQDYNTVLERLADEGFWVIAPVQPQFVPQDPVLTLLGTSRDVLQDIVHADATQVAGLLFATGPDGTPQLNEVGDGVTIPSLQGKQVGISGHSLGGGMTWSIVQGFPGRFDKLAVMAPFPTMVDPAISPPDVIGKPNPATGGAFQPPGESLILEGGFDILAFAPLINRDIYDPLEALSPKPAVTKFKFPFGTHTGYQDFTGIGTVLRFPAGVLVTIPEARAAELQAGVGAPQTPQPRVELILGASTNTKVYTLPRAAEDVILALLQLSAYAVYGLLLVLLLLIGKVTGSWADAGGFLAPLWHLLSAICYILIPIELFEVFYYTPVVQRPQSTDMIGDFMSVSPTPSSK